MKVPLRILVLLLSFGIVIFAILPPSGEDRPEPVPAPTPNTTPPPQTDPNLIRDFLGGAQLDAGKKATDVLNEVNASRREDLEELGLE